MIRPSKKATGNADTASSASSCPQALRVEHCLAKTRIGPDGVSTSGRSVEDHCRIVQAVAQRLWAGMPAIQKCLLPAQSDIVPLVHDVGKICPTFQEKIRRGAGLGTHSLPELCGSNPDLETLWGGHAAVSLAALKGCHVPAYVAEIAGQHHGFMPVENPPTYSGYGGTLWQDRRRELLERLLGESPETYAWPKVTSWQQARLLSGLTIVADWIGSGSRFDDPDEAWENHVDAAVSDAGFMPFTLKQGLGFDEVFPFSPLEIQQRFYEQVTIPGVYILEAPMGVGKTEAALYAAYAMLERGLSTGIYFALPTQLTSNRIYQRLNDFLDKILVKKHHAHLLHGKAWLNRFMQQEMGEDAAPSGSWFHGKKRGILAPFAAGTIDQALMAVMRVKHGAVRAFGLAGKVVILDEVHSYDAYTGVILDALVDLLRHYGCTVIILSATLTAARRGFFTGTVSHEQAYPLISAQPQGQQCVELAIAATRSASVTLQHCTEDATALEEALLRAEQGQQVLWIENTVVEAQERYRMVAARTASLSIETGLIHSRFTPLDREHNESHWTALYGKNSIDRALCGRILVGTQVLEQSLDIDADFLISRFCPTDMLLQRMGRLWRHEASIRPCAARREAWLLHPPVEQVRHKPASVWGSTGNVYAPYILYRSLEQWEQLGHITLPDGIRPLLEATYAERAEHDPELMGIKQNLIAECQQMRGLALSGISTTLDTLPEEKATTRLGQYLTVDVLLLRQCNSATGELTLAHGEKLVLPQAKHLPWVQRQGIAAQLTLSIVRAPEYLTPPPVAARSLDWLRPWLDCGTGKALLRIAIIGPNDSLQDMYGQKWGAKVSSYRKDYGLST